MAWRRLCDKPLLETIFTKTLMSYGVIRPHVVLDFVFSVVASLLSTLNHIDQCTKYVYGVDILKSILVLNMMDVEYKKSSSSCRTLPSITRRQLCYDFTSNMFTYFGTYTNICSWMDICQQTSVKILWKYNFVYSRKCIRKCRLRNGGQFD